MSLCDGGLAIGLLLPGAALPEGQGLVATVVEVPAGCCVVLPATVELPAPVAELVLVEGAVELPGVAVELVASPAAVLLFAGVHGATVVVVAG